MTEPTDAELTEVYKAANGEDTSKAQPLTTKRIFRAMRAAITKWGTPPAVAKKPVAVKAMGYGGSTGINDYLMSDGTVKAMRPAEVRWATPDTQQPTQAQAGSEQLIQQMLSALQTCQIDMPGTRFKRAVYDEHAVSAAITAAIAHIESHGAS
ncbi:hypothetical protein DBR23_02325 [Acidovorax sp. HMWF018]|uniref:hypothetical protein n=1 Tax=Acidovorax sp. HMWF018 TaxID=2056855 RepID=UPI000D39F5BB|nr:hypothetical protein [Acidovorax sp. HMWF018]PTT42981.1 hypothetical protein DBR23_02325 [Acidovorax sp. HMWF018]